MKALTVRNPWAWAIIHGGKDVENRAQTWGYRGRLAIHASAGWSREGELDPRCVQAYLDVAPSVARSPFMFGVVLGVATLTDVHRVTEGCCDSPWADAEYNGKPGTHLVLTDAQPVRSPIRAKGALGLWTLPDDVERSVCEQIPAPAVPL